jgi:hypothetical protein
MIQVAAPCTDEGLPTYDSRSGSASVHHVVTTAKRLRHFGQALGIMTVVGVACCFIGRFSSRALMQRSPWWRSRDLRALRGARTGSASRRARNRTANVGRRLAAAPAPPLAAGGVCRRRRGRGRSFVRLLRARPFVDVPRADPHGVLDLSLYEIEQALARSRRTMLR